MIRGTFRALNSFRVGIAGWVFPPWRKTFYPKDLVQKLELEYASRKLRTIEINSTFYALPKLESYEHWYRETPEDFIFSVKGPKFVTHIKRLREVESPVANFFASGLFALKEKLGPIVWQLPPNFKYDHERIESFLKMLPNSTDEATRFAKKHQDAHLKQKPFLQVKVKIPLRYALEVRNLSFMDSKAEFIRLLKKYNVALVCTDPLEGPAFIEPTADFAYARLHGGSLKSPVAGYSPAQLKKWASAAKQWNSGTKVKRDVFIYIVNEAKPKAPMNAMTLQKLLK
jgi:uncharacterized protein YecE (DUF72 family)